MHILIVGAGIGGLTLAQSLRKQGISFEIFERDVDENARFQGWAIALHTYEPTHPVGFKSWKEASVMFYNTGIVSLTSLCPLFRRICPT